MKKALTYISFAVTSLLVILSFVTATTYLQLGLAIAIYPVIAFFAYQLFVVKNKKTPSPPVVSADITPLQKVQAEVVQDKKDDISIKDIDKRAFLKLIGATGISFFLFSLLNRRTDALFLGGSGKGISSLTDKGGKAIDPSERQPLDGYVISEIDDGYVAYYGFTNQDGAWYIMREDPEDGSFRYIKGDINFISFWTARESLTYDYFHNIFEQ